MLGTVLPNILQTKGSLRLLPCIEYLCLRLASKDCGRGLQKYVIQCLRRNRMVLTCKGLLNVLPKDLNPLRSQSCLVGHALSINPKRLRT